MVCKSVLLLALIAVSSIGSVLGQQLSEVQGWSQFRGDHRNGSARGLPASSLNLELVWDFPLPSEGVGGIAATEDMVVVSSRDINDSADVFFILNPVDGGLIVKHEYSAIGRLDYGNSPRATPIIGHELVYVQGAFGHLVAIDPAEGKVRWQTNLVDNYDGKLPTWGYCVSPLLVGGQLIVQPGGSHASIVSLQADTGKVQWKVNQFHDSAYASPCLFPSHPDSKLGHFFIVCEQTGLVGLSLRTGQELWRLKPEIRGEFMVPSPIVVDEDIYWIGESNGIRVYRWDGRDDSTAPKLISHNPDIASDTHTPTTLTSFIVTIDQDLIALDPANGLCVVDRFQHNSLNSYAAIMTEQDRALICCSDGTVLLLSLDARHWRLIDEARPYRNTASILASPALANGMLYLRRNRSLACYRLKK